MMMKKSKKNKMDDRCPRNLKDMPTVPCRRGERAAKNKKGLRCPWFVNDKESHWCFWVWQQKEHPRESSLAEIAYLIGSNISTVNLIIIKAIKKLAKRIPKDSVLRKFFTK